MSVLPLVTAPDPRLKLQSEPIVKVDAPLRAFMADMLDTMYANNGIGLAAIQVGSPQRVAVIHLEQKDPASKIFYLVNPVIVAASKEQSTYNEGCLSVPDIWDDVKRPARLTVEYTDENGERQTLEADGLLATALQHEIDHINGMLFIDHLSRLKRSIALRKAAKNKRLGED